MSGAIVASLLGGSTSTTEAAGEDFMAQLGMALGGGLALGRNGRQAGEAEKRFAKKEEGRMLVVDFCWGLLGLLLLLLWLCQSQIIPQKINQLSGRHCFERIHLRRSLFCDV